jgi:hypothetical protein
VHRRQPPPVIAAAVALALAPLLTRFCDVTGAAAPGQIPDHYARRSTADVFDRPDVRRNPASARPQRLRQARQAPVVSTTLVASRASKAR